jgi:RNA-binding protein YlmH
LLKPDSASLGQIISDLIKSEKVFVNWEMVSNSSKILKAGDTVSVRGYGRIVLTDVGGQSRKGRTIVRITVMV